MGKYFGSDYAGGHFVFFSTSHLTALITLFTIYLLLYLFRALFKQTAINNYARFTLALLLIAQELFLNIWHIANGTWSVATSLPLHLCGVAIILSAVMLINNNYKLYELNYFWGLGGAIQALLTPDIGNYGFPHFRYFQFFISHGLIIRKS